MEQQTANTDSRKLGERLLEHRWITEAQLQVGARRQKEIGGRLGTCLLEIGAISEELLLRVLSEQLGVPKATADDLRDVEVEVFTQLPPSVAVKYHAIPFRQLGGRLDIAMPDLSNIQDQDELAFVIGKRINLHVATEVRIAEALERYYGRSCAPRFTHLLERLDRPRSAPTQVRRSAAEVETAARSIAVKQSETRRAGPSTAVQQHAPGISPPAKAASASPAPTAPAVQPVTEKPLSPVVQHPRSIPLSADEKAVLRKTQEATNEPGLTLEDVETRLARAQQPDEVGRALVDFLGQYFDTTMLFRIIRGTVRGWMAQGPRLKVDNFRRFELDLDVPSVFFNLDAGNAFSIGRLAGMAAHQQLADCWDGYLSHDAIVFPIRIERRLAAVMYVDKGPRGTSSNDLDLVRRLSRKAELALKICIMHKKLRGA